MLESEADDATASLKSRALPVSYTFCNKDFDSSEIVTSVPVTLRKHLRMKRGKSERYGYAIFVWICDKLSSLYYSRTESLTGACIYCVSR